MIGNNRYLPTLSECEDLSNLISLSSDVTTLILTETKDSRTG